MATLTLSHHANADHTVDDLTVGQRVKAHPRFRTRSCVGMCTGLSDGSLKNLYRWSAANGYWVQAPVKE